jgi:hypothetical protein
MIWELGSSIQVINIFEFGNKYPVGMLRHRTTYMHTYGEILENLSFMDNKFVI